MARVLVARRLLLREHQRRLRLLDLRFVGVDLRLLYIHLRVAGLDAGLGAGHLRLRLFERDAVVAIVDARDDAARRNVLVVGDRDRGDVAGDPGGDGELARRDEGVVSEFEMRRVVPVKVSDRRGEDERDQTEAAKNGCRRSRPLRGLAAGVSCCGLGCGRLSTSASNGRAGRSPAGGASGEGARNATVTGPVRQSGNGDARPPPASP